MKQRQSVFASVLKKNKLFFILYAITILVIFAVYRLYNCELESIVYTLLIVTFFLVLLFAVDLLIYKYRDRKFDNAVAGFVADPSVLPVPADRREQEYTEILLSLMNQFNELNERYAREKQDMADYYTAWVHQVKTPIAVMRLSLQNDTAENHLINSELFRVEQYVDMALSYVRLGSETNDLLVREYSLDEIIRETVHKYAEQFILKKLNLVYTPTDVQIITDKKWFSFLLEQILSNAIKYTAKGQIAIKADKTCLSVEDTGIGISAEDLPRIFEKGYTGINGRIGQNSSGLGLYLCAITARKLSLTLSCESTLNKGSKFTIQYKEPFS